MTNIQHRNQEYQEYDFEIFWIWIRSQRKEVFMKRINLECHSTNWTSHFGLTGNKITEVLKACKINYHYTWHLYKIILDAPLNRSGGVLQFYFWYKEHYDG